MKLCAFEKKNNFYIKIQCCALKTMMSDVTIV